MSEAIKLSASEVSRPDTEEMSIQNIGGMPLAVAAIEDRAIRMSEDTTGVAALSASAAASDIGARSQPSSAPLPRSLGQVTLSDCGCGGGAQCNCGGASAKPSLVYVLGKLGYDFGSEARRDSFIQAMPDSANNPSIPDQLLSYLGSYPEDAPSIIWTLNLDATPIYAIQPAGPYAASGYERLREFLNGQQHEGVDIVSIPGVIAGSTRLQSGQTVPVIVPTIRGMHSWATQPLVAHVLGPRPEAEDAQTAYDARASGLTDFLNRIYYDLRNLGITAEDRAQNYAATNAFQAAAVVSSATEQNLDLDTITVKKSPICRPDSECYDVEVAFFDPRNRNIANRIYRFTVDVSDVLPVTIGPVRSSTRRV
jgi:cyanobactin maturation PatA/PatG family protease